MGLSYREIIECRYIGLFSVSKSISYRTSNIEYLDILKTSDFFVFFRRKFSENSENSPKIPKTHEPKSSTTTTTPKIPKIRRKFAEISVKSLWKFLQKKVFSEATISYRYRIVSISYRIEKKTLISYRYRIESKKSLSPKGGGEDPAQIFVTFSLVYFWSRKGAYFLPNANNLNFNLFF